MALVLALLVFVTATFRKNSNRRLVIAGAPALVCCVLLAVSASQYWPLDAKTVSFFRMGAALAALAAVCRMFFTIRGQKFHPTAVIFTLGLSGAIAFGSFLNLGNPQFFDQKSNRADFVHSIDMQVYFPLAKYLDELRFDGIYAATILSITENYPDVSMAQLNDIPVRDLRDHQLRRVSDLQTEIQRIRARFSDARWAQFKQDAKHFTDTLGLSLALDNLVDHGGNATPVWLMLTRAVFAGQNANHASLMMGAMVDIVLLLLLFVTIARVFSIPTALVAMVVFGANDYYMGGTNWAGATLRHDWMAALGFGICALQKKQWLLAGAALMLGALIRAFPGVVFVGISVPALWWWLETLYRQKRLPSLSTIYQNQKPILMVALGAFICAVVLVGISCIVFPKETWVWWFQKVSSLNSESHTNNVSLKFLFSHSIPGSLNYIITRGTDTDWQEMQRTTFESRRVYFLMTASTLTLLWAWVVRKRTIVQSALLGLLLIPVWLDPANYYQHIVFLLPLLVVTDHAKTSRISLSQRDAALWMALLLMCAAQYATVLRPNLDDHFLDASVLLLLTYGLILALMGFSNQQGNYSVFSKSSPKTGDR